MPSSLPTQTRSDPVHRSNVRLFDYQGNLLPKTSQQTESPSRGTGASGPQINYGIFDQEYLSKLRSPARVREFAEMLNDAAVSKELSMVQYPLLNAECRYEAPQDPSPEEKLATELCNAVLLRQPSERYGDRFFTQTSWRQRLYEILSCLEVGYALFIKERDVVDGHVIFSKLKFIEPKNVTGWWFTDEEDFLGVTLEWQAAGSGRWLQQDILSEDLQLYTWQVRGIVYDGKPYIRPMWGAFTLKNIARKLAIINIQRQAAPAPKYTYSKANPDKPEIEKAQEVLKSMRSGQTERSYYEVPHGGELGFMEQTTGAETSDFIRDQTMDISRAGVSMFTELGSTGTGSRSVADQLSGIHGMAVNAVAGFIADVDTSGIGPMIGLAEELTRLNFPGALRPPKKVFGTVDKDTAVRMVPRVLEARKSGAIPWRKKDGDHLRKTLGWIAEDEDSELIEVIPETATERATDPIPKERGDNAMLTRLTRVSIEEVEAEIEQFRLAPEGAIVIQQAPAAGGKSAGFARGPVMFERTFADLAGVDDKLDQLQAQYLARLQETGSKSVRDVADRVRSGEVTVKTAPRLKLRFLNDLTEQLGSVLRKAANIGADETDAMLGRQAELRSKTKASRPSLAHLAKKRIKGRLSAVARQDVKNVNDRLLAGIIQSIQDGDAQGLGAEDLADLLEGRLPSFMSPFYKHLADQSDTLAFNEGQADEIEGRADVDFVIRTEILDDATCKRCKRLDGMKLKIGTKRFFENLPPAKCLGGRRCRAFLLPVMK